MSKALKVCSIIGIAAVGALAFARPALAEGGCGPYEPTVCNSHTGEICIDLPGGRDCYFITIDTYGKKLMDE